MILLLDDVVHFVADITSPVSLAVAADVRLYIRLCEARKDLTATHILENCQTITTNFLKVTCVACRVAYKKLQRCLFEEWDKNTTTQQSGLDKFVEP